MFYNEPDMKVFCRDTTLLKYFSKKPEDLKISAINLHWGISCEWCALHSREISING